MEKPAFLARTLKPWNCLTESLSTVFRGQVYKIHAKTSGIEGDIREKGAIGIEAFAFHQTVEYKDSRFSYII